MRTRIQILNNTYIRSQPRIGEGGRGGTHARTHTLTYARTHTHTHNHTLTRTQTHTHTHHDAKSAPWLDSSLEAVPF